MKLKQAIENLGKKKAIDTAEKIAKSHHISWKNGANVVFKAIVSDTERVPGNIGSTNDDEEGAIKKWILRYKKGKDGRASQRTSNPPGTVSDPIIKTIIGARLSAIAEDGLNKINYAHRLAMSAENILGLILEEFLAVNLEGQRWHCAWGETIKSVDFVHEDGQFLQIKNRSNSENSSSSTVRNGTEIEKWFRIKADREEYMWPQLNKICGTVGLSESMFVSFVQATLASNPHCLAVEPENPWN